MLSPASLALILAVSLPLTLERHSIAVPPVRLLSELIATGILAELRWPDFSDLRSDVARFYEFSGYTLAWTHEQRLTPQARDLVSILPEADRKGLNAEDYDGPHWAHRASTIEKGHAPEVGLVRFDVALTVSAMRYVTDVSQGKIDPSSVHSGLMLRKHDIDLAEFLEVKVKNAPDVTLALNNIEPPFDGYWRTLRGLQTYLNLARSAADHPSFAFLVGRRKGSRDSRIAAFAGLLKRLGDLSEEYQAIDQYDEHLVEAVKHFQLRHGLNPSGQVDPATLRHLNTPMSHRVRQLQLTLERWRWIPHTFAEPPIVVNVPEFRLRGLNNNYGSEIEMKVVVGKAYRHRTPIFTAEMTYIIFHPYWNVPLSIQRDELIPAIARDPSYLRKHGYEIVSNDGSTPISVEPTTVLAELRSGKFGIRQTPGARNALGRVKFIFPNENDVYMHDTPEQAFFSRVRRDFSHGCIRVERPEDLAAWVLRHNTEWPRARIRETLEGSTQTRVRVMRPIPVLIVYATAVVLKNDEVRFFDDIYGHDAELEQRLAQVYRSDS